MKIALLSNNPLSFSEANGRTMLNLLHKFQPNDILNIYLNDKNPAFGSAIFYRIDEHMLLNIFAKKYGKYVSSNSNTSAGTINSKKTTPTVFKRLVRSLLWKRPRLNNEIIKVVSSFGADVIIIQTGDSDFLINLAVKLSKKIKAKLFSYNSEDYPFKRWNYISKKNNSGLLYKLFKRKLFNSYRALYKRLKCAFYLTHDLCDLYLSHFPNHCGVVIYNSGRKITSNSAKRNGIVYLGNIEVGRADTLVLVARLVKDIFGEKLRVYTSSTNPVSLEKLKCSDYIELHNAVSYEENLKIIQSSRFVLHVESFDEFFLKDTRYAFSTKIPDCLISGTPLILLSPKSTSSYKYLEANHCAIVSDNIEELGKKLRSLNEVTINEIVANAKRISSINHDLEINSNMFYDTLLKYE